MMQNRDPDIEAGAHPQLLRYLAREDRLRKRRILLLVVVFAVVAFALYSQIDFNQLLDEAYQVKTHAEQKPEPAPPMQKSMPAATCETQMPPSGRLLMINPSEIRRTDVAYSGLSLDNEHDFPVVLVIGDVGRQNDYAVVPLQPGNHAAIDLPIGRYGLTLLVGRNWCSLKDGFSDGHRITVNTALEIRPGAIHRIKFYSVGEHDLDVRLLLTQESLPSAIEPQSSLPGNDSDGTLVLQRQPNGGFFVNGTVNNVPVVFQIDTGASMTSIPREIAMRAGIYNCNARVFETANGSVMGCTAQAGDIRFGSNDIRGMEVAVMPNLKIALLGMNVLRYFRIEHAGDIMRISLNQGAASLPPQPQPPTVQYSPPPPALPVPAPAAAPEIAREQVLGACTRIYEADKEFVNARMRAGYTAQQGEFYRERLRQIEESYDACRKRAG